MIAVTMAPYRCPYKKHMENYDDGKNSGVLVSHAAVGRVSGFVQV